MLQPRLSIRIDFPDGAAIAAALNNLVAYLRESDQTQKEVDAAVGRLADSAAKLQATVTAANQPKQ